MMFELFTRHRGPEPKPPPDMGRLLIQALQLCILGAGFLIYLDNQRSLVIWISIAACIGFGVAAGILLDKFRTRSSASKEDGPKS